MSWGGIGFFGKLPGRGDFVQRRLPPDFVAAWDTAFEAAVAAIKGRLGADWNAAWEAAPAWRFVLAPGICGASAWIGVTSPSVDRVGRGFPMVLAAPVPDGHVLERIACAGEGWFAALESLSLQARPSAGGVLEAFDAHAVAMPSPESWLGDVAGDAAAAGGATAARVAWRQSGEDPQLRALWAHGTGRRCMWWTRGAGSVPASVLLTQGLPGPDEYGGFIAADLAPAIWRTPGNCTVVARAAMAWDAPADMAPIPTPHAVLPDDLDAALVDLLGTPRGPDGALHAGVAGGLDELLSVPTARAQRDTAATIPMQPVAYVPAVGGDEDSTLQRATGAVRAAHRANRIWHVVVADNGPVDARRCAATQAAAVLAQLPDDCEVASVCERLQALHPALWQRHGDLLDPVPEDGALVLARVDATHAQLLRVGAACAWHWRHGQLRPLFDPAAPASSPQSDTVQRWGDLVDSGAAALPSPGLGAAEVLRCDRADCDVATGDKLLLLATDTLAALPAEGLAGAMQGVAGAAACARIAALAGLGGDQSQWPVAVIEVGT